MTLLSLLSTSETDPYLNLAREEVLCETVAKEEIILYLWQNKNTIVIGRNQNPWKECRVEAFEADGGRIARRLSGGGAVFHDLGNLNFTFVARDPYYDVTSNCAVVCEAVRSFGLNAQTTGRNDITIEGAKFSGNAFVNHGDTHCHHGTLMVNVDFTRLSNYLNPDPRKLATKGVDSVKSRVVNLADLHQAISTKTLATAMIAAAEQIFDNEAQPFDSSRLDAARLTKRAQHFSSRPWRFGTTLPFTHHFDQRFVWGDFDLNLLVKDGLLNEIQLFSDALDTDFIARIADSLPGCPYNSTALQERLNAAARTSEQQAMAADCIASIVQNMT